MASTSSSSSNWVYDVFPSFSGEDVRKTFLSHFLKELNRKLISVFKDNEMERGDSIGSKLEQAIKDSRIAVVVFSENYASSSWCLNELLEIVQCKKEFGQLVIPIFYRLDPSHVRKQSGQFGEAFDKTCLNKTEQVKNRWQQALTNVANTLGYHCRNWDNEATMIEEIANDVLAKLNLSPSNDFHDLVGIEDHIAKMSLLLCLESEEVKMVGIWGPSGIGKTTIARALFGRLSRHFPSNIFIDRAFISKSMENFSRANPDDYNMKLHLQRNFLSDILSKKDIKIDHLGAVRDRLKNQKVLIIIDDIEDQVVLDALVGRTQWFRCGSRIIVVTTNKHLLLAHGINHFYEVCLPPEELALEMLCQSAFRQNSPPDGFAKLVVEVAGHVGSLPLGLNIFGSYLRGRDKEYWMDMLPRLRKGLDGKIEKTLRVSYDGLDNKKDKAIFRYIACLFNRMEVNDITLLLADNDLDVNIGLKSLVDKSLIHVRGNIVEMHHLLEEMGKEIVRTQSNEPGEREFLWDSNDICDVLVDNTGTKNVLGISLDIDEIDELHVHERAFKVMRNLRFLKFYAKPVMIEKAIKWYLPECFDLPPKLRLLCWDRYPLRCMPFTFSPKNLVELRMQESKLEKLWEEAQSLLCLKHMDLWGSENLKEIPDLSLATNLETLNLSYCANLVDLPSSIRSLNNMSDLYMHGCIKLETLPTGFNLKSLCYLDLSGCLQLKSFPRISSNFTELDLENTAIEEFPSDLCIENLVDLRMERMQNEKLWQGVHSLKCLKTLDIRESVNLKEIPDLSLATNLETLNLSYCRSLVELPLSIRNLNKLTNLDLSRCIKLETLPIGINLEFLYRLDLNGCSSLRVFPNISTYISELDLSHTMIEEFPSNMRLENLVDLRMEGMKSGKLWESVEPLTRLMAILSPSVEKLSLSDIPSLVELPCSLQNLSKLTNLTITECKNLETLPTSINLESLHVLDLRRCSRLASFPYISSNIASLILDQTAITEVPWWIENFSKLQLLSMRECNKLKYASSNIYKLRHLETVNFSDCGSFTEVSWHEGPSLVEIETNNIQTKLPIAGDECVPILKCYFINCSKLDQDSLIQQQSVFNQLILSGKQVPSYFTHRTTESSLTIPLLHTSLSGLFFRFRLCLVIDDESVFSLGPSVADIKVSCQFRDRDGNHFDSADQTHCYFEPHMCSHLVILDCCFSLNKDSPAQAERNYDHAHIQFHLIDDYSHFRVKECGIRPSYY